MKASAWKLRPILAVLILIGGIIPLFHYWFYIGRVPSMKPLIAQELLSTQNDTILLDVRSTEEYQQLHIENAQNWPYSEIIKLNFSDRLPPQYLGKSLLLIGDGGVNSARATQLLRSKFKVSVYSVSGGMQAWITSAGKADDAGGRFIAATGEVSQPPFKASPWYEQIAMAIAVLIIKPLYMLIALALIILMWRLKSADGLAVRWGLTFFLAGETACAVNIVFFDHSSYLLEFFHMYGMVLSFAFFTYGIFEMLDTRILNFSDPKRKCTMAGLCRQCVKYSDVPCGLKRMFYFLIPVLIILAFIPILAKFNVLSYNTKILGMLYNYSHPVVYQFFELRYAPTYAIVFIGLSFLFFLLKKNPNINLSKLLLAIGLGPFAFSYLRLIFFSVYHDNLVWANVWEELTELMYTSGVAFTLWIFQPGIFGLVPKKEGTETR